MKTFNIFITLCLFLISPAVFAGYNIMLDKWNNKIIEYGADKNDPFFHQCKPWDPRCYHHHHQ